MGSTFPKARIQDLVMTSISDELMVYDTLVHRYHHLEVASALVWRFCDGRTSLGQIATLVSRETGRAWSVGEVEFVVDKLAALGLMVDWIPQPSLRRWERRKVAAAIVGAGIASISAPMAAAAQSGGVGGRCTGTGLVCDGTRILACVAGIWTIQTTCPAGQVCQMVGPLPFCAAPPP